jgi:hypothetical protein
MNRRKEKCAVVCAEQLTQSACESPKKVCVWVTREVTRCIEGQKGAVSNCQHSYWTEVNSRILITLVAIRSDKIAISTILL